MRISGKVRLSGVGKIGRPVSVTLAGSMLLVGIGCGTLTPPADKGAAADRKADNPVILLANLAAVPATGEGSALRCTAVRRGFPTAIQPRHPARPWERRPPPRSGNPAARQFRRHIRCRTSGSPGSSGPQAGRQSQSIDSFSRSC